MEQVRPPPSVARYAHTDLTDVAAAAPAWAPPQPHRSRLHRHLLPPFFVSNQIEPPTPHKSPADTRSVKQTPHAASDRRRRRCAMSMLDAFFSKGGGGGGFRGAKWYARRFFLLLLLLLGIQPGPGEFTVA